MRYVTESEARNAYLVALLSLVGIKEGSTQHVALLNDYNQITPLPRGHKAVKSDSWCAITVAGQGWKLGYRKWPWECSCTLIREEAKRRGIWRSGWESMPKLGDWIIYNWDQKGGAEHIGVVCAIIGNAVWVVEGNYDNAVKIRRIYVGDARVEGSVALDFSELVQDDSDTVVAMRPGDSGENVRRLQFTLYAAGYYGGILDGEYGERTTEAVRLFQQTNGLEPDGKAGPITQGRLRACDYAIINREVGQMPEKRYNTIDEIPEWARPTIQTLIDAGKLKGDGAGLHLTLDMIRVLVIMTR